MDSRIREAMVARIDITRRIRDQWQAKADEYEQGGNHVLRSLALRFVEVADEATACSEDMLRKLDDLNTQWRA